MERTSSKNITWRKVASKNGVEKIVLKIQHEKKSTEKKHGITLDRKTKFSAEKMRVEKMRVKNVLEKNARGKNAREKCP